VDLRGLGATSDEVAALADALGELTSEEIVTGNWAEGVSDIDELEQQMAELRGYQPPYLDDLSRVSAAHDLANDDGPPTSIELVNARYGPGTAERIAARGVPHMVNALAREIDRSSRDLALKDYRASKGGNRRAEGDILGLAEAYATVGAAGSAVEAANQPGYDSHAIELARYAGEYPDLCSTADRYGRCSSRFHASERAHNTEASASRGYRPQDSAAWQGVLARHSGIPAADSLGRAFRTADGSLATFADHAEAGTGQRTRREGLFEQGPRTKDNPGRPELVSIQPQGPGFSRSTAATARAFAAQAGLATAADHQAQREAWKREHDRREAAA
jgi:hypothetical protein